jgi:hypothetical protein
MWLHQDKVARDDETVCPVQKNEENARSIKKNSRNVT